MKIKAPTGMSDFWGEKLNNFRTLEQAWRNACESINCQEIITPILEEKNLFVRTAGENSDIVSKEMFECGTLVLRPEGTAPIMRFLLEQNLSYNQRFFYFAPFFRKEKPQKGRFRQFFQYGVEVFGETAPQAEIEVFNLLKKFYDQLNVKYCFEINYLPESTALNNYTEKLKEYYQANQSKMSSGSLDKLAKNSILRILDSKEDVELNSGAPKILDFLSEKDLKNWNTILDLLNRLKINYKVNPCLVRGLDYYEGFVFEVIDQSNTLGSQKALGGGGRYNKLSEQLGATSTVPAFGFGGGVERLLYQLNFSNNEKIKIGVVCSEASFLKQLEQIKQKLQASNNVIDICYDFNLGFKKMFKRLDKMNFNYALILGTDELNGNFYKIKNLKTGEEKIIQSKISEVSVDDFN